MVGSPEMAYLIPRWSGSFNYSKNIAKEFADGDQTRSYDINISTNFELDLLNPEDTILFNPFYFEQDSIQGLYEINHASNFTSPNYSYTCIANRSGLTSLNYPSLAFLNINPEDSSYTFQIMFKVDGNILLNCTSSSGGDLEFLNFGVTQAIGDLI